MFQGVKGGRPARMALIVLRRQGCSQAGVVQDSASVRFGDVGRGGASADGLFNFGPLR
jgi:hypothetical protein